jgi:hypothetical protein
VVWPLALLNQSILSELVLANLVSTYRERFCGWLVERMGSKGNSVQVLGALLRRRTHRPMAKKLSGCLLALQRARLWSAADEPKDRSRPNLLGETMDNICQFGVGNDYSFQLILLE